MQGLSINGRSRISEIISTLALCGVLVGAVGCEPEMPVPPPRESTNPAEDDFLWAMERMEHAIDRFRPSSSLGLSVKREMDYELIHPAEGRPNYEARVTIATKTVYRPDAPPSAQEKKQAEAAKERGAKELKLDNPYTLPGGEPTIVEELEPRELAPAELPAFDVPEPRVPTQRIDEKKTYLLEYVNDQWKLKSKGLEKHEQMWFDYALQQGDFSPEAGAKL
jgi:hypothetical protein